MVNRHRIRMTAVALAAGALGLLATAGPAQAATSSETATSSATGSSSLTISTSVSITVGPLDSSWD